MVLPPAASPWECGSPTPVTRRPDPGRAAAETWGHCRRGVDGFGGVTDAKGGGGRGAVRRAGCAWVLGSVGP